MLLLLVFAAFANAAGMVAPVAHCAGRVAAALGWSLVAVETAYLAIALLVAPLLHGLGAGSASRLLSGEPEEQGAVIAAVCRALVPLAPRCGWRIMDFTWRPARWRLRRRRNDFWRIGAGSRWAGHRSRIAVARPTCRRGCCGAEIFALDFGLLASLYVGYRIALARYQTVGRAARAFLPWGALALLLFALAVWIVLQPMEMRGMMAAGGEG